MKRYLTRSEYCLGIRCPALLWSQRRSSDGRNPFSERALIKAHNRTAVEEYTKSVNPCRFIKAKNALDAHNETLDAINAGELCISGATFISGALSARCDMIKRRSDGTYALYVIKAAAHLHQTVCHDASYQVFVLATRGIRVSRVFFVRLNTGYVMGKSEPEELFICENISSRVASLVGGVEGRARNMLKRLSEEEMPSLPIHNGCFNPSDCEYRDICFKSLPKDNIFTLSGISHQTKFKLYRSGRCDITDAVKDPSLSPSQKEQLEMFISSAPPKVDKSALKKFIDKITYPICYLDFETMQLPFPPFDGLHPFEPCAFQFSLHIQSSPDSPLEHISYIGKPGEDPRRGIAEALVKNIPANSKVGAYNMQLEKMMLLALARRFDDLKAPLSRIAGSLFDMMHPFERKWYYDGKMKGACSLKAVLRALYPDDEKLDYKRLSGVHNGQEATTVYAALSAYPGEFDEQTILRELEDYCSLDTLALVKLMEKLKDAVDN